MGFPGGRVVKNPPAKSRTINSINSDVPTLVVRRSKPNQAQTEPGDTHQAGGERGRRLAQGLAAHAHEVGRLRRGCPGLPRSRVWKEVPACRG